MYASYLIPISSALTITMPFYSFYTFSRAILYTSLYSSQNSTSKFCFLTIPSKLISVSSFPPSCLGTGNFVRGLMLIRTPLFCWAPSPGHQTHQCGFVVISKNSMWKLRQWSKEHLAWESLSFYIILVI